METNKRHSRWTSDADLHVRQKEDGGESRTITGRAILFDTPSDVLWADDKSEAREVIAPEAITREVLDRQDIKFTMFHDRQLILARSIKGKGTLKYDVDEKGVTFEFEAPATADGDKALELVRRGDLKGCSFMFATPYRDKEYVERSAETVDGRQMVTYRVKKVLGVYDFTLAADPAYPDTSVSSRETYEPAPEPQPTNDQWRKGVSELREKAKIKINY